MHVPTNVSEKTKNRMYVIGLCTVRATHETETEKDTQGDMQAVEKTGETGSANDECT